MRDGRARVNVVADKLTAHIGQEVGLRFPPAPETDPHARGILTAVEFDSFGAWIELDGQAWINLAHVEQVTPFRTATR